MKTVNKENIRIGDKVKSNFRAKWKGVVVGEITWSHPSIYGRMFLPVVALMVTPKGKAQPYRKTMVLNYTWLEKTDFDDKLYRKDWDFLDKKFIKEE